MENEIIVVSGLPRSGTSLMMQMLESGGLSVLTDHARTPDVDNPKGYFELEGVKTIKKDSSWIQQARGKAVKMVSQLLYDLPPGEKYRIIFMERDMEEVLLSQRKMLTRLHQETGNDDDMRRFFALHLKKLYDWLSKQKHIEVLYVSYNYLLTQPMTEAQRINEFVGEKLDAVKMTKMVDQSLYRNRKAECDSAKNVVTPKCDPLRET